MSRFAGSRARRAIENFDGLERLFVICVGLDARIDGGLAGETRSRLYRAMTRAQLGVIVVNARLPGGWLEFLGRVSFRGDEAFDEARERERGTACAADDFCSGASMGGEEPEKDHRVQDAAARRQSLQAPAAEAKASSEKVASAPLQTAETKSRAATSLTALRIPRRWKPRLADATVRAPEAKASSDASSAGVAETKVRTPKPAPRAAKPKADRVRGGEARAPTDIVEQSIWTTTWEAEKAGAVTSGFLPFAASLEDRRVQSYWRTEEEKTPLWIACDKDDLHATRLLLTAAPRSTRRRKARNCTLWEAGQRARRYGATGRPSGAPRSSWPMATRSFLSAERVWRRRGRAARPRWRRRRGVAPGAGTGETALFIACQNGHTDLRTIDEWCDATVRSPATNARRTPLDTGGGRSGE